MHSTGIDYLNLIIINYTRFDVQYFLHREKKSYNLDSYGQQIRQCQNFFSALSEQIMDRQNLSCSMEVCGVP
jgi:hypothetical protein